jgi:hypothetical protein
MFVTTLGASGRGITMLLLGLQATTAQAGPSYETDDPEPVDFGHWEFYLATQPRLDPGIPMATTKSRWMRAA